MSVGTLKLYCVFEMCGGACNQPWKPMAACLSLVPSEHAQNESGVNLKLVKLALSPCWLAGATRQPQLPLRTITNCLV